MENNIYALIICLVAYAGVFAVLGLLVLCIKCLKWVDLGKDPTAK